MSATRGMSRHAERSTETLQFVIFEKVRVPDMRENDLESQSGRRPQASMPFPIIGIYERYAGPGPGVGG